MKFDHTKLPELFSNVELCERLSSDDFSYYIIKSAKGDSAYIKYFKDQRVWWIEIDNFPHNRKYFETNFPIETKERFISEMKFIGIELIEHPTKCRACEKDYFITEEHLGCTQGIMKLCNACFNLVEFNNRINKLT